jgi:hypothetical protein
MLALHAPRLTIDLFPLSAWIDPRFQLGEVDWTIADLDRTIGCDDAPRRAAAGGCLVKQFLFVR